MGRRGGGRKMAEWATVGVPVVCVVLLERVDHFLATVTQQVERLKGMHSDLHEP